MPRREKTEIELAVATAVRCLHERGDGRLSNRARKILRRALDRVCETCGENHNGHSHACLHEKLLSGDDACPACNPGVRP